MFEDSPDYVSEVDDIREARAPDLEDIDDEEDTSVGASDDEAIEE